MLFQPFNKNAKLLAESFKRIVALKLIGTTVVGLYACYFYKENIPRAGPIRALILGWRTQAELESLREQDVEWIKNKISVSHPTGGKFYVVRGPRGIGKSVAVDWATNNMPGVIKIPPISPGKSKDEILDIVCSDITGLRGTCLEHRQSMKRIIFFFKLFNRRAPVVIIPAGQCERNKTPAELTNAARELVDTYGLIVLIDLSENAFPHVLSGREVFYDMEPMSDEMMRKLPGFEDTFESLKKQGNEEIVLRVCGGRPIILEELKDRLIECKSEAEKLKAVEDFVEARLDQARIDIENVQSHPNMAAVCTFFSFKLSTV